MTVLSTTPSVCFWFNNLFDSEKRLHFYPQQGKGQALALPRALALALPRALALGRASGKGSACYINSKHNRMWSAFLPRLAIAFDKIFMNNVMNCT